MSKLSLSDRFRLSRFFSGEKATTEPITLSQRRIFIIPTQRGLGFAVLIALLLLIAFVYGNNLTYLLAFLLASVFFITILHTYRSMSGLVVQAGQSPAVFAGENAGFTIFISNPSKVPRYNVQVSLEHTEHATIPAFGNYQVKLYSSTKQRGWHPLGKVTVASIYPFGLFRAWSPLRFEMRVLVYPKPAAKKIPFPETASAKSLQGTSTKGNDDFYGLQTYHAGDSLKHIDWKTYAKGIGLFTKQYSGDNSAEIWLDYEHSPGYNPEERLSQLCRWVLDAEQAGIRYGFALPGTKLNPDFGQHHYQKCLEALALF